MLASLFEKSRADVESQVKITRESPNRRDRKKLFGGLAARGRLGRTENHPFVLCSTPTKLLANRTLPHTARPKLPAVVIVPSTKASRRARLQLETTGWDRDLCLNAQLQHNRPTTYGRF